MLPTTSSTVYKRLLRGDATSREYVNALLREVRERRLRNPYKSPPRRANDRGHGTQEGGS